jgi:hypothetical protein
VCEAKPHCQRDQPLRICSTSLCTGLPVRPPALRHGTGGRAACCGFVSVQRLCERTLVVTPWSRMISSWSRRTFSTTHSHALCECGESSTATPICLSVCVATVAPVLVIPLARNLKRRKPKHLEIVPHSGLALLLSTLHGWVPVYPRSCTRGWHNPTPNVLSKQAWFVCERCIHSNCPTAPSPCRSRRPAAAPWCPASTAAAPTRSSSSPWTPQAVSVGHGYGCVHIQPISSPGLASAVSWLM